MGNTNGNRQAREWVLKCGFVHLFGHQVPSTDSTLDLSTSQTLHFYAVQN